MTERTCIKSGFHDVHALFHIIVHSVHARCYIKCLLGIFLLVWTPMSTKLWDFLCYLIRNMFGSLVVYLTHLASHVHFSCIGHALHIATSCTHFCYPCHALVYTLFLHPSIFVALCFVLGLSFIFSFILHPSCIISIVRSIISCPLFSLTLCLFLTKRGRVYSREYTGVFLSFLYDFCAHP